MAHTSSRLPGLILHWRVPHCLWIQYQREQNRFFGFGCILFVHVVVGPKEFIVSAWFVPRIFFFVRIPGQCARVMLIFVDRGIYRSWVLILGVSGLIVLFWFVGGGVALRYLVSAFAFSKELISPFFFRKTWPL